MADRTPPTICVKAIADYFLTLVDEDTGDSLSNLKLQKLVYYAQGFSLALRGVPLFREGIEAWEHGPVVPDLYRSFKQHKSEPIPAPSNGIDLECLPSDVRELLDEVFTVYGQFSASKLRKMTHEEPPWKEAYEEGRSTPIGYSSMKKYFSTLINEENTTKEA